MNTEKGKEYDKREIEQLFGIRFGYKINGIVVRKDPSRRDWRLILLFSKGDGTYPDNLSGSTIQYVGAGLRGDQELKGVNKLLLEHGKKDGFYLFHQEVESTKWKYLGTGKVISYREEEHRGRKILVFSLELDR